MLERVEIENFLSIKEKQFLKISNRITTIIGENASGKTAILKAIEKLNGIKINSNEKNINLKSDKTSIIARFCIDELKKEKLNNVYEKKYEKSIIRYPQNKRDISYELTVNENGELEYNMFYKDNGEEFNFIEENESRIIKEIEKCLSSKEDKNALNNIFLLNSDNKQNIEEVLKSTDFLELINKGEKSRIDCIKKEILDKQYEKLIPNYEFIYFNSFKGLLVDELAVSEIKKNAIVKNFLEAANIKVDELIEAVNTGNMQYIKSAENQTLKFITKDFRRIFSQVKEDDEFQLTMSVDTNTKKIYFWIRNSATDTDVLKFSDESEGTQWYLSMYLRLYEYFKEEITNKTYILLLDEPNVYLNAVAQKDLLEKVFKENLNDMQIIYTTHSPYMIDAEDLYSLRIVHKDDTTRIFNTTIEYLDYKEKTDKRKDVDVLSPVLVATGINISNQLILDKKDNLVVVEGPHDYYVLNAMKKILKIKLDIKFIPCTSCEKVPFMCGYLVGLGYKVLALVDNDAPGRRVINQMKKQNQNGELYKAISYSKEKGTGDCILENLFSDNDFKGKIGEKSTPNYRKIYDENNNISFEEETKNNFKHIFKLIEKSIK